MSDDKVTSKVKADEPKRKVDSMYMYLGPTIFNPVPLVHRAVFKGGPPKFLLKLPKPERDALEDCCLPLPEAGQALRELEGGQGKMPVTMPQ